MSDDRFVGTDAKSIDTRPESPRLIKEDTITLTPADYSGTLATIEVDMSEFTYVGDRLKGGTAQCFDADIYSFYSDQGGGTIEDYYTKFPYTSVVSGSLTHTGNFYFYNLYIIADGATTSKLIITFSVNTVPSVDVQISYKIYSTIFDFDEN